MDVMSEKGVAQPLFRARYPCFSHVLSLLAYGRCFSIEELARNGVNEEPY